LRLYRNDYLGISTYLCESLGVGVEKVPFCSLKRTKPANRMTTFQKYLLTIVFCVAIYMPIFWQLDSLPIQMWDESRNAVSAIEMMHNGDWLVRHYQNGVDTWETKPMLLLWLQILFFKILGINTLAVRLPSALATLGIVWLMYRFFKKELNNAIGGVFAGLALVISEGFIRHHVSRTGDHDALLTLLLLWSLVEFYYFIKTNDTKNLIRFAIATTLAVLTKSVVGFLWLPAFFLYALFSKKVLPTLQNRYFYLAVGIIVGAVGGYYGICEWIHPGHFGDVWRMELVPRYTNTAENNHFNTLDDKWFYVKQISYEKNFFPLWQFLSLSLLIASDSERLVEKRFTLLLVLVVGTFLFIISNGCVNDWYDAPVYPLLAMLVGIGLSFLYRVLVVRFSPNPSLLRQVLYGLCFFIIFFAFPYQQKLTRIAQVQETDIEEKYGLVVRDLAQQHPEWRKYVLAHDSYQAQFLFSMHAYQQKGFALTAEKRREFPNDTLFLAAFQSAEKVLVFQKEIEALLQTRYELEWLYTRDEYKLYRIVRIKPSSHIANPQ
jgi:4-amino-4-deoxy-L-arabinose transferase-like glycosyltransferase